MKVPGYEWEEEEELSRFWRACRIDGVGFQAKLKPPKTKKHKAKKGVKK